ncbi:hypothetical protein [Amycolatopsis minnesotensis]|uniref:Uncharacterized protein n=1 Tax=Amycolatopsis minnesotensis TaxID=337894 RepID=A0ABN2SCJ3_9PSEU
MSAFEVLSKFGTLALVRFTAALALFVAVQLVRLPLLGAAWLLEFVMRVIDAHLSNLLGSRPATPPRRRRRTRRASSWTMRPSPAARPPVTPWPAGPADTGNRG